MGRRGARRGRGRAGSLRFAGSPGDDEQAWLGPVRRDIEPEELARLMRAMVGLDPHAATDGERVAWARRSTPTLLREVDVGGWMGWCMVGLVLFAELPPAMSRFHAETKRIAVALTMLRSKGSISASAGVLGLSRSVVRKYLRDLGLYPWHAATDAIVADDPPERS